MFRLTKLANCMECGGEIANDAATETGWIHVVSRLPGALPDEWEFSIYGDPHRHSAWPKEGTIKRYDAS